MAGTLRHVLWLLWEFNEGDDYTLAAWDAPDGTTASSAPPHAIRDLRGVLHAASGVMSALAGVPAAAAVFDWHGAPHTAGFLHLRGSVLVGVWDGVVEWPAVDARLAGLVTAWWSALGGRAGVAAALPPPPSLPPASARHAGPLLSADALPAAARALTASSSRLSSSSSGSGVAGDVAGSGGAGVDAGWKTAAAAEVPLLRASAGALCRAADTTGEVAGAAAWLPHGGHGVAIAPPVVAAAAVGRVGHAQPLTLVAESDAEAGLLRAVAAAHDLPAGVAAGVAADTPLAFDHHRPVDAPPEAAAALLPWLTAVTLQPPDAAAAAAGTGPSAADLVTPRGPIVRAAAEAAGGLSVTGTAATLHARSEAPPHLCPYATTPSALVDALADAGAVVAWRHDGGKDVRACVGCLVTVVCGSLWATLLLLPAAASSAPGTITAPALLPALLSALAGEAALTLLQTALRAA